MSADRRTHRVARRDLTRVDVVLGGLVSLVAGVLRFVGITRPRAFVLDEIYYARDACRYAGGSAAFCGTGSEQSLVHPPMGKWLIAAGIKVFAFNPFGWRVMAAVAGSMAVGVLYFLARKTLCTRWAALIAAGFLSIDFMHFVHSRIAMLDVFVSLFALAAFAFIAFDKAELDRGGRRRRWRAGAGFAAGLAMGTKWSGLFVVMALVALTVAWETRRRRAEHNERPFDRAVRAEFPSIALLLVAVPLIVYVVSFIGRVHGSLLALPWTDGAWAREFVERQSVMLRTSLNLDSLNTFKSPAWSWLLLKRPFPYYTGVAPDGSWDRVWGGGSPLAWWASVVVLIVMSIRWLRRRGDDGVGFALAGFAWTFAPWLLLAADRSAFYIFYMVATVPYMCLALGWAAEQLPAKLPVRAGIALFLAGAVGAFVFFYPVLADVSMLPKAVRSRELFRDCSAPSWALTFTPRGALTSVTRYVGSGESPPGWCWGDARPQGS